MNEKKEGSWNLLELIDLKTQKMLNKKKKREIMLKSIADETLNILKKGFYHIIINNQEHESNNHTNHTKKKINILKSLNYSIHNSKLYSPKYIYKKPEPINDKNDDSKKCLIEFMNESTINCARKYFHENEGNITILNYASAKKPGGGFKNGKQAQEECIARSSGLYYCIKDSEFYKRNKMNLRKGLYTDNIIYSPKVPVFRNDMSHELIPVFYVNIITSPAVNRKVYVSKSGKVKEANLKVKNVMRIRMKKILNVAVENKTDVIVLGAFGCGVFGNEINFVAKYFRKLLRTEFKGCFKRVGFAVIGGGYEKFKKAYES